MCQILIFLNVTDVNKDNHKNLEIGRYLLVHFVKEKVLVMFWKTSYMERNILIFVLMTIVIWLEDGQKNEYDYTLKSSANGQ